MSAIRSITFKYLRFMSASRAVLAMTIISIVGIAIGVATLTVTYSVAGGFGDAYRRAILDFSAHVILLSTGEIENAALVEKRLQKFGDQITGVSPFLYREGLLIHDGQIRGVLIKGVTSEGQKSISNMEVSSGGAVVGKYLAQEMGVNEGDTVRLMLPEHWKEGDVIGFETFPVSGTFETGMYDFDSQFVLINLKEAQQIFNAPDKVSGIEIKLSDWKDAPSFARALEKEFVYPLYATDWQELNQSLFQAVGLEKLMFAIIMGALVVVAAFNIVGTVMLKILYKTSDISILRALGMNIGGVKRLFILQGLFTGFLGTVLGMVLAFIIIWSVGEFGWIRIPEEIYLLSTLPVCISWRAGVLIAAFSLGVSFLASVVAARKVLSLSIVRGLHRS